MMQKPYIYRKTRITYRSDQYFDIGTSFIFMFEDEILQIGEVISVAIAEVYGKAVISETTKYPNQYIARRFQ
jgi:hypothetical protein